MAESKRVILDAGHGGSDPGAVYFGRQEKEDNLRLALAVGSLLAADGVDVTYTRVEDTGQSPAEKAEIANRSGADYFVSFHRNAMPVPGTASGAQVLIYENGGESEALAKNVQQKLTGTGLADLGVIERPDLIVLRQTQMPAILVEAGFIDNDADNRKFDEDLEEIAKAVAGGILETIRETARPQTVYYQVQIGAYVDRETAQQVLNRLTVLGLPAFMIYQNGYYKVRVGAFLNLDNAARMEKYLRELGYSTYMVREAAVY